VRIELMGTPRSASGSKVARHIGLLHEAVAQLDVVHALAEMADGGARVGRHVRFVGHHHGEQHDLLVQHLVVLEVVQQAVGCGCRRRQ
jgi:hypothetical protein